MNNPNNKLINIMTYTFIVFGMIFLFSSCNKKGCTDSKACNYSSEATKDDGTCNYGCLGIGSSSSSSSGGSSSGGSSSGGSSSSSSGGPLCTNTCAYAFDGVCDDGGPGSAYSVCDYGSDCADCGPRYGSSSSSSGGNSYGDVSFYTMSDFGCGNITVTVSGQGTRYITSYYSSGISGCNLSGNANFSLPPGSYSYSASCSGYTWGPASFTITSNGCLKYQLN